jgi:hypothetical protein
MSVSSHGALTGMYESSHTDTSGALIRSVSRTCQECGERGVMEGRLCGRLVDVADPRLAGAQVTAAYRFAFDASEDGGRGALQGTVEGLAVRNCAVEAMHPLRGGGYRCEPTYRRPSHR